MTDPSPGLLLARMPAPRRQLLDDLAGEILAHYRRGRTEVAVDGRSGAGKSRLADDLALALRGRGAAVFRASADDFHYPRAHRWRAGRYSPEGYYRDAFDYPTMRRVLLDPFRFGTGAGFSLRAFDLAADRPYLTEWVTAPADAVLVVDGVLLQRPELRGTWNYVVYLDVGERLSIERVAERDGITDDPASETWRRYLGAQKLYDEKANPRTSASAMVDAVDLDAPFRVFSDFC